jgi:hypothetical protein
MRISRIDQTLQACEEHLSSASAFGTEIEMLLTQSLLVLICSEFEQKIENIVQEKCAIINDVALREFIGSCVDAVFRSVKSSEIAGLLNRFGPEYKGAFKRKTEEDPVSVTFFNSIVTNRHCVAHSTGSNVSFNDVKEFYEKGHIVLDYFRDVLMMSSATINS